ncbi:MULTISPECIES: addiction module protein [Methylomicrobium]|nr:MULTISPECIES: addiction module protein [Methylomicrobium]
MSQIERLQTMEIIWDSLLREDAEIDTPDWHESVLADRKLKIEEGKAQFRAIEELRTKRDG